MTRSESFSFYRQAVLEKVKAPANEVDAGWLDDMVEFGWTSDLDAEDTVDVIQRAQTHGGRK